MCPVFGATVELERSPMDVFGSAGLRIDTLPVLNLYTVPKPGLFHELDMVTGLTARQVKGNLLRLAVHDYLCPAGLHVDGEMRACQINVGGEIKGA